MKNENYKLTQYSINTIMQYVESSQIAIPQLQRPFVWKGKQVKDLIDSLYQGYPIGYLIVWQNSNVRLKYGKKAFGKKILIDGQQRITALMAAIMGKEILDEKYHKKRIQIAFNPYATEEEERFAVYSAKLEKDTRWIPDISVLFQKGFAYRRFELEYRKMNPDADLRQLDKAVSRLKDIAYNEVGVVELSFLLDIDVVTEIFIRINSQGKPLNQEDFAMSRISVNEEHGGDMLQKAIDHFCHLCLTPEAGAELLSHDTDFLESNLAEYVSWLKDVRQDLYVPAYSDVLKTAFAYKFGKVKIAELVNLLSGKCPGTKEISQKVATDTFLSLKDGILSYMSKDNFGTFLSILQENGYRKEKMMGSKGLLNGVYFMFLLMREAGMEGPELASYTMRWYLLNALTGRYQTALDTVIAKDYKEVKEKGAKAYIEETCEAILDEAFWQEGLPEKLKTTMVRSNVYGAYVAAMVKNQEYSLFSKEKTMEHLMEEQVENSQIYPKVYLEKQGITSKDLYGQVANCIYMDKAVKRDLKRRPPMEYLPAMLEAESSKIGEDDFTKEEIRKSLAVNAIPVETAQMDVSDFETFLYLRRKAMAEKIHSYYINL